MEKARSFLFLLWVFLWIPGAFAQDSPGNFPIFSSTRSSPFNPPTQDAFVADAGPGLDTGCTFNTSPEHPLMIDVMVDRYLGAVDANGYLINPAPLIAKGVIPSKIEVIMPAYDVDVFGGPPPEKDEIRFNGELLGVLNGDDGIWLLNSFTIDITKVKFPATPGGAAVPNRVQVTIDVLSTGSWCTAIDWVALVIPIKPVVAVTLTSGGNPIHEVTNNVFWKQTVDPTDPDCNITDEITDLDQFPFSGPLNTIVGIKTELAFCPSGPSSPKVQVKWKIGGKHGTKNFSGTVGYVDVKTPKTVQEATAHFDIKVEGQVLPKISRKLFVTKGAPMTTTIPKREWYERAVSWAKGEKTEKRILKKLLAGEFAFGQANWRYGYEMGLVGKCKWEDLVADPITCDYSDCYVFSAVFDNMARTLGIASLSERVVYGAVGAIAFLTKGAPSLDPAFPGNSVRLGGTTYDKYLFGSHSLMQRGASSYYDATFKGIYNNSLAFVQYNLTNQDSIDTHGYFLKTMEGTKVYPRPDTVYATWQKSEYTLTSLASARQQAVPSPLLASLKMVSTQAVDIAFTGVVNYNPTDLNGDGIFDQLEAEVEVDVLAAGSYLIRGTVEKAGQVIASRPLFKHMFPTQTTLSATPGRRMVKLHFSGEQIFQSRQDGPYTLKLVAISSTSGTRATATTPAYDHRLFGELGAGLTGVSDQAVDLNGDSKYDEVEVTVDLVVRTAGRYDLQGSFLKDSTDVSATYKSFTLAPGTHSLKLHFPGRDIHRSGYPGPYEGNINLSQQGNTLQSLGFMTKAYDPGTFSTLLTPNGNFNDAGIDTNGNSLSTSYVSPSGLPWRRQETMW